jgi:hypothetical protein
MDAEQWDLLRQLVNARLSAPDSYDKSQGFGGELFRYLQVEEDQWVRHPGLPDSNLHVRSRADLVALEEAGCIAVAEMFGREFTFVVTDHGVDMAQEPPGGLDGGLDETP